MTNQPKLGECLRGIRRRLGLTLSEVGQRTGVALSTLSKVENDQMSLTYDKLLQICNGLEISLADLLTPTPQPAAGYTRRSIAGPGNTLRMMTPNYEYDYLATDLTGKRMIPIHARLHARTLVEFGPLISHPGEEFGYVISGEVEIHTEHYTPRRLTPGESFYIDSTMGHAYLTVGKGEATMMCVCYAPDVDLLAVLNRSDAITGSPESPSQQTD